MSPMRFHGRADLSRTGDPMPVGPHMAAVTIALPAGVVPDHFLDTLKSTIYVGADFSGTTMAFYQCIRSNPNPNLTLTLTLTLTPNPDPNPSPNPNPNPSPSPNPNPNPNPGA